MHRFNSFLRNQLQNLFSKSFFGPKKMKWPPLLLLYIGNFKIWIHKTFINLWKKNTGVLQELVRCGANCWMVSSELLSLFSFCDLILLHWIWPRHRVGWHSDKYYYILLCKVLWPNFNTHIKVIHPKYYKHFKKAPMHSHLDWFLAD